MILLPYDRFVLISNKTPQEIEIVLGKHVEERSWLSVISGGGVRTYIGRYNSEWFKFHRAISYRNSFLPVIVGRITPHPKGARISVTQRLHVAISSIVVFSILMIIAISTSLNNSMGRDYSDLFFSALMLFFIWALSTGCFWFEARHTRSSLQNIMDAEIQR